MGAFYLRPLHHTLGVENGSKIHLLGWKSAAITIIKRQKKKRKKKEKWSLRAAVKFVQQDTGGEWTPKLINQALLLEGLEHANTHFCRRFHYCHTSFPEALDFVLRCALPTRYNGCTYNSREILETQVTTNILSRKPAPLKPECACKQISKFIQPQ